MSSQPPADSFGNESNSRPRAASSNPYRQTKLQRFFTSISRVCGISFRQQHLGKATNDTSASCSRQLDDSNITANTTVHPDLYRDRLEADLNHLQIISTVNNNNDNNRETQLRLINTSTLDSNDNAVPSPSDLYTKTNEFWGDELSQQKPPHACRLYFQNVHGLRPTHRIEAKWNDCLRVMKDYDVDIFGFTETCLNWADRRLAQQYKKEAKQCFGQVSLIHSHNSYKHESTYLPGGTLQVTVGSWIGRVNKYLHDPHRMGRWTGVHYNLSDTQSLYVISLYRVGKNDQLGVISSFTQQTMALQTRFGLNTEKTPRLQVLLDLQDYLESLCILPYDHLIIMTDANETIGEDQYGLREIMSKFSLVDLFTRHHQRDCEIATYKLSENRRIDYIIGTSSVLPYIIKCGYLPFDTGVASDHRGLFVDLDPSIARGSLHIKSPPQRKIGYSTSKKEVKQYKQSVLDQFRQSDLINRAQRLYDHANPSLEDEETFIHELNAVDAEVTRIVLDSEQTECTKKLPFNWTPEIHNASLLIKYWKLKYNSRHHQYNISLQLQNIYDQLSPERQISIIMATGSDRVNLRRAKQEKMELYKIHREKLASSQDKRLTADSQYLGIDKEVVENQYKHRLKEDRMFQYLKTVYPKTRGTGITHIEVPDCDHQGHVTDDPTQAATWKTITDSEEMTARLLQRNIKHFGQASRAPFASSPLRDIFGYCGTNDASIQLVREGIIPAVITREDISSPTTTILQGLSDDNRATSLSDNISFDEFWRAFKVWDEQTSTSPSGRHLGHYKSLMMSDGHDSQYDETNPNPSDAIKRVYYHIAMAALYSANPLTRWCNSSTMMLEKIPGQPKIHKLRVIHIYEADYNLLLKILWARRLVWHSHCHSKLHEAQAGSRPDHRCSDVVIRKEMNYQYAKFTRTALATVDNDAKACYDRIICNLAMLVSQYFGMSNRACKLHSKTLKRMRFKIRTGGGDSKQTYSHSTATPVHGSGQGSCASPSLWLHISSLLLRLLDDIAQGMTHHDVKKNHYRRISAEGFVDDIALFINHALMSDDNLSKLYELIHQDINAWQQLLASSGGKLELEKCFYYVLSWRFNKYGDPIPKTLEELRHEVTAAVKIIDPDTSQVVTLQQKEVTAVHKTLGVYKSIAGTDEEQRQALLDKSNKLATQTKLGQLTRYQARRAYAAIYMPSMTYSLVATSLSASELQDIQSQALRAFLPAMGYEPTFPRAIVHGPRTFGGLNIGHLYTEMQVAKIGSLLAHIQASTGLGSIMSTNINWLQIHSGLSRPVLQYPTPLSYLSDNWFLNVADFLYSVSGSIVIPDQWLPQKERKHDVMLMDVVLANQELTNAERRVFNNWRLYFQATTLADITDPAGVRIHSRYWSLLPDHSSGASIRRSRHNWPCQAQPHPSTFRIWKKCLRSSCRVKTSGELSQPLGDWTVFSHLSYNDWNDYIDVRTRTIYRRQSDDSFWSYLVTREGHNRSTYSATPEEIVYTIPTTCVPIQIEPHEGHTFIAVHRNFVGPTSVTSRPAQSFDGHLENLPQWRSDLITHWHTQAIDDLRHSFQTSSFLRLASDGSYQPETRYGAFGAVIGNETDILMQVQGHAPGNDALKSSFRSELYGLLAALVLVYEVTTFCQLSDIHHHTLQIYIDSRSVMDRVQHHRHHAMSLGAMVAADVDVELQILEELKQLEQLGFRIPSIQHVKAHQDQHTCYSNLSREAQLNVAADELAATMSTQQYYNIPYSIFPTTKIQLRINDQIITSKYKESIRTAYLTQDMYEYYQAKFGWDNQVIEDIWWDTFGTAIKQYSHADRQKLQKFHVRRLHTNNRQHFFQTSSPSHCPHCPTQVETNDHIILCQHCTAPRLQIKEDWKQSVFTYLSDSHMSDAIRTAIIVALTCWMNGETIPPLENIVSNASQTLARAYADQTRIGWDNLVRGKLSTSWADCIEEHLRKWSIGSSVMTPERWATRFITVLWDGILSMWDARNRELYGHDSHSQTAQAKTLLLHDAQTLLRQGEQYHLLEIPWLNKPISELEQYNVVTLKAWVRNARTLLRLYVLEQQKSHGQENDQEDMAGNSVSRRNRNRRRRIPMDLQGATIPRGT